MSFEILTDSASNLTDDLLEKYGIHMLSCFYLIDDVEYPCYVPGRDYAEAGREFYHKLRNKVDIKTSLINTARLIEFFEPFLQAGRDILFSPISSGLSGTFQAAQEALPGNLRSAIPSGNASSSTRSVPRLAKGCYSAMRQSCAMAALTSKRCSTGSSRTASKCGRSSPSTTCISCAGAGGFPGQRRLWGRYSTSNRF